MDTEHDSHSHTQFPIIFLIYSTKTPSVYASIHTNRKYILVIAVDVTIRDTLFEPVIPDPPTPCTLI